MRHTPTTNKLLMVSAAWAVCLCLESPASAAERNDAAAGNWNAPATWSGVVPGQKDTAVVDSHVVTLNVDLSGKPAPQRILLSKGGTIIVRRGRDRIVACPITLAGGIWASPDHWSSKDGSTLLTGQLLLAAESTFTGARGTQVRIQGELTGNKKLLVTSSDVYYNSAFTLSLEHPSKHTGGVELVKGPYVSLKVSASRALGLGPVSVNSGTLILEADQDYGEDPPPTVTITSPASLRMETERVNLPLVFDGGRITTSAGKGRIHELAGSMRLAAGGVTAFTARNRSLRLTGSINGTGALHTTKNDYYYQSSGCTWTTLSGKNNSYSGGTNINPGGGLQVVASRALGTGPVEVRGAGIFPYAGGCLRGGLSIDVQQNYPPGAQPAVLIKPQGALYVNVPAETPLNFDVTLEGGELSGSWREEKHNFLTGTVTLTADSFLGGAKGSLGIQGKITGPNKLTRRENAASGDGPHLTLGGPVILSNPKNDFAGGLDVAFGTLKVRHPGALGTGPVRVVHPAQLQLEKAKPADWKLSTDLTGTGTVRIEDGSSRFRLTADGTTIRPGSGGGTLTIEGSLAFPLNATRRGMINAEILSGLTGVVYGKLHVRHHVEQLSEGILNINIDDQLTAKDLQGQSFEILRCDKDLTGSQFHAVSWDSGWTGRVEYGKGFVRLSEIVPVDNILRKVTDSFHFGEILGKFAPQFSTAGVGPGGLQLLRQYAGRTQVLRTHPLAPDRPCILRAPVVIPAGKKTKLLLSVSHRLPQGDWRLIVKAGDQTLYDRLVAQQPAGHHWSDLAIDLTPLAGKKTILEIHNHPTNWSGEDAYFSKIELISE